MRTDEKLTEVCNALTVTYGDLHKSARAAGLSPTFVMQWIKDDKEAAARIEEAQRVGWLGLDSVALDRAVVGVAKGVYFKGEKVGTEFTPSDTLLVKIMEARIPAFKKGEATTFNGPTQINLMPRAANFEEWLAMKDKTLENRVRDALPALPAPVPEILQGEYVEVTEDRPLASLGSLL